MARTEQERILIAEKAKAIREKAKGYSISAYELGQNTTLSIAGAKKILEGSSQWPSNVSLEIIQNYIAKTYENVGTVDKNPDTVAESKSEYMDYKSLSLDEKLEVILKKLDNLEVMQKASDLKQSIIFEITKLAKGEELKVYEQEFTTRLNSEQKPH